MCDEETIAFPKRQYKYSSMWKYVPEFLWGLSAVPGVPLFSFPVDLVALSSKQAAVCFQTGAEPMVTNESWIWPVTYSDGPDMCPSNELCIHSSEVL